MSDKVIIPRNYLNENNFKNNQALEKPNVKKSNFKDLLDFIWILPYGIVLTIQGFYLGKIISEYTHFPFFNFHTYQVLIAITILVVTLNVILRSIIFSSLFILTLIIGIYTSWFDNILLSIVETINNFSNIIREAWQKKNLPYPILMSTITTIIILLASISNFIFSLFTKYFFEIVFGVEWSHGKRNAFIFSILLVLLVHIGLYYYISTISGKEIIIWSYKDKYRPFEEYISKTNSATIYSDNYVWNYDNEKITCIDLLNGKVIRELKCKSILPSTEMYYSSLPFIATDKGIVIFDKELLTDGTLIPWPIPCNEIINKLGSLNDASSDSIKLTPVLMLPNVSKDLVLVHYDYGIWSGISLESKKVLWTKIVDQTFQFNRLFLEDFLNQNYVIGYKDSIIFSCNNGKIVCINKYSGDKIWDYSHSESKFGGKGQRAYLSLQNNYLVAAFQSGSIVKINPDSGSVEGEKKLFTWSPISAAYTYDKLVYFINSNKSLVITNFYEFSNEMNYNLSKPIFDYTPINYILTSEHCAYLGDFYKLNLQNKDALQTIKHISNRNFITKPVTKSPFVYIGTDDGWVFCFHNESLDQKWSIHIDGMLTYNSLAITSKGLLVRTKSGSLYLLKENLDI